MELDTVELVMEIEEAFDISIPDDRASEMTTVGDVYEFILSTTAATAPASDTCITAAAFYDLRRHLRTLGLANFRVRPRTKLNRVIPIATRRSLWHSLGKRMHLRFPPLHRPSWLILVNCMVVAALVFSSFVAFAENSLASGLSAAISVGVASSLLLLLVTQPFALYPYSTCSTVRELVTSLVAINYTTLSSRYSRRNPSDIWSALQLIVCEQLGVDRREVIPDARFVEDLGAA